LTYPTIKLFYQSLKANYEPTTKQKLSSNRDYHFCFYRNRNPRKHLNFMKTEKKEVVCIRLLESIKKKVDAEAKKMYLAPSKLVSIIVQKYYESKN
jgi:hypothetical protein